MSEQIPLFETESPSWVELVWQKVDVKKREEIVAVLVEMARSTLAVKEGLSKEVRSDES